MKYVSKPKTTEYGKAEIELYDKDGNITNRVIKVPKNSILYYTDDKAKTGFTDISGVTCIMKCKFDTTDGEAETTDTVEIIRQDGNKIVVKLGDKYLSIYKGVVTFVKG